MSIDLVEITSNEDASDWLLTDKVSSWPGNAADRAWRYLRQALERHDGPQTSFAYNKVVLETILGFERSQSPPPWLISLLEVNGHKSFISRRSAEQYLQIHHPEFLVRTYMRYEVLEAALDHVLAMLRKVSTMLGKV